ncbi:MAG: dihydrolipoyllysine-residue acetyltransferase, partial [Rhodocyclaceae bacterium]
MAQLIEVKVPDIGDFSDIPVIELNVKVGDTIAVDDSICTLESDKATMDVPSSIAGVVKEILVGIGSKVSEGTVLVKVEGGAAASAPVPQAAAPAPAPVAAPAAAPVTPVAAATTGGIVEVKVPDIGDFDAVPVIELNVKVGDTIAVDDSICTLESDKATMDVPSSAAGVVKEVLVKVGDKVGEGALLIKVETAASAGAPVAPAIPASVPAPVAAPAAAAAPASEKAAPIASAGAVLPAGSKAHASPSVRAYARELGADLGKVAASGPKGRITKDDVTRYVKGIVTGAAAAPGAASGGVTGGGTLDLLPWPKVDFAKFGPVEAKPLSRIKKISGANLARNWVMIPHVTQFDEADITDLEAFRVQMNKENEKSGGAKLTMLAFLIKACVAGLKKYPEFNASLDGQGDEMRLVLKQYFHIGFAADTPNGLVVPVIRDCDKKGLLQIAQEMGDLAKKARDGKLGPADMT